MERQQRRLTGKGFNFENAVVKVDEALLGSAFVGMLSLDERRSVAATFLVDLREKAVTNYRHFVATPVGDERVRVARYANGRPVRVFPQIIIGKGYVVTEDGRRLSYQQFFAEEQNYLEEQQA